MKEIKKKFKKGPSNKQPSNIEAEQALMGSILVNNDIIDEICINCKTFSTFLTQLILRFMK